MESRRACDRFSRLVVRNGDCGLAQPQLFRTNVHGFDASAIGFSLIGPNRAHAITAYQQCRDSRQTNGREMSRDDVSRLDGRVHRSLSSFRAASVLESFPGWLFVCSPEGRFRARIRGSLQRRRAKQWPGAGGTLLQLFFLKDALVLGKVDWKNRAIDAFLLSSH